jgi:hypothetical protein
LHAAFLGVDTGAVLRRMRAGMAINVDDALQQMLSLPSLQEVTAGGQGRNIVSAPGLQRAFAIAHELAALTTPRPPDDATPSPLLGLSNRAQRAYQAAFPGMAQYVRAVHDRAAGPAADDDPGAVVPPLSAFLDAGAFFFGPSGGNDELLAPGVPVIHAGNVDEGLTLYARLRVWANAAFSPGGGEGGGGGPGGGGGGGGPGGGGGGGGGGGPGGGGGGGGKAGAPKDAFAMMMAKAKRSR